MTRSRKRPAHGHALFVPETSSLSSSASNPPSRQSQRTRIGKVCRERMDAMVKGLKEWEAQPATISFKSLPEHVQKFTDKDLNPAHIAQVQNVRQSCMRHIFEQYKDQEMVCTHMCLQHLIFMFLNEFLLFFRFDLPGTTALHVVMDRHQFRCAKFAFTQKKYFLAPSCNYPKPKLSHPS